MIQKKKNTITAEEFDKRFDDGEDISEYVEWVSQPPELNLEQRRVNVDLPAWVIESLDLEAKRIGVTRQSIIKVWLADRLERTPNTGKGTAPQKLAEAS